MKLKRDKSLIITILLSVLLFASLSLNFYQKLEIARFTGNFENEMYKNIEEIKSRNEYIYLTTDAIINAEVITTNEILDLYNNYKMMYLAEAEILEANLLYKNVENAVSPNNIFLRAEEYIKSLLLNNENKSNAEAIVTIMLAGEQIQSIKVLRDVAEEINNYFINLENTDLKNKENDEKIDTLIKKDFWVEIMEEIQKIGDNYSEYAL